MSKDLVFLLGLTVGAAVAALVPWQFAAIAVCLLFLFNLATHYAAQAKLAPKLPIQEKAKFGDKEG